MCFSLLNIHARFFMYYFISILSPVQLMVKAHGGFKVAHKATKIPILHHLSIKQ